MKALIAALVTSALWAAIMFVGFHNVEAVTAGSSPKLTVGKAYMVIYNCQRSAVPTKDGVGQVDGCYAEMWVILDVGKDGWVRFRDGQSGEEWYGNLSQLAAIREYVAKAPEPAAATPRIRASQSPIPCLTSRAPDEPRHYWVAEDGSETLIPPCSEKAPALE